MEKDMKLQTAAIEYCANKADFLFLILSRDGRIAEANAYAQRMIGRSLKGEKIEDVIIDFDESFDLAKVSASDTKEHLLNVSGASGLPQSFYFTFRKIGDGIMVFGRLDAEDLEEMRKEILSLNQDLANLTRDLHRKNAQLKELNEEKNRFLGMAAHDLRKPIGLIISYSEFLVEEAETVLGAEQVGFLNTIHSSGTFMKRLVDDFLDVSAIEAGKFSLDFQSSEIHEVLERSLELNSLQARRRAVRLDIECEQGLPRIPMDFAKVEQAMTNLISNAIEHSDTGGRVGVVISRDEESILFAVQDEGPGIPEDEQDRLFKPFEKTSVRKIGGEKSTGLGMVIIRKIVEAHQGRIWVESKVGEGTIISFSLPLTRKREDINHE